VANYLKFSEIVDQIERALKTPTGAKADLIKDMVNMVYLQEILSCDDLHPLFWLCKFNDSYSSKDPATITGISIANPMVITAANTYAAGDIISIHGVVGTTQVNDRFFVVSGTDLSTASFKVTDLDGTSISSAAFTAWSSGGTCHHRGMSISNMRRLVRPPRWINEEEMFPIGIMDLEASDRYTDDNTTRPERYLHRRGMSQSAGTVTEYNQLIWFPGADADYHLRYWYEYNPDRLANDTDVPLIPYQFQAALVAGVLTRLSEYNVQVENAVIWPQIYQDQLNKIVDYNRAWWREHGEADKADEAPFML